MPLPKVKKTSNSRTNVLFLGVDCGEQGGISLITDAKEILLCNIVPESLLDLDYVCKMVLQIAKNRKVVGMVERLTPMPFVSKSTAFTMGYNLSKVEAMLTSNKISYSLCWAKKWQERLNLPKRSGKQTNKEYKDHKERLRQAAQKAFPNDSLWEMKLETQRAICDAILISDYCRITYTDEV